MTIWRVVVMNFNFLEDRSKEMEEEKAVEGENES